MQKRYFIGLLIIALVAGSLSMMLSANMFFADVLHMAAAFSGGSFFVTFVAAPVALFFVIGTLYLIRLYRHPECKKALTRHYAIVQIVLSGLGIVCAILSAVLVYHSFVGGHPFPGYLILYTILNVILIGGCVLGLVFASKMDDDTGHIRKTVRYVFKTIGWFLFISLTFNRFGTFIASPFFIYWRNFYATFPFYLYLLLPVFLGVLVVLHAFGILSPKKIKILAFVSIGLNVAFFAYTAIMGINDTAFISSLSQAMPLERLASKPVELPIHFLTYLGVSIGLLVLCRKPKAE